MRTILLASLMLLLSMSGIVFAVAEGSPLAGMSLVIALATFFFVDTEELFAVPPVIANSLGIVAFIAAASEFFRGGLESRLLAGGHLIIYLTWVFMIQRKSVRHIWWLSALSILQMATASVLTSDIWFGFALLAYAFLATWTLCVFLLYRSTLTDNSEHLEDGSNETRFVVGDAWRGISRDVDYRLLNWRFVAVSCIMTCLGLLISMLFFLLTPRIWIGDYDIFANEALAGRALTGFTDEVRLGDMGEILENNDPVFAVEVFDSESGDKLSRLALEQYLGADPLFRGTVMEEYETGKWKQLRPNRYDDFRSSRSESEYMLRFNLEPIGTDALFTHGDFVYAKASARAGQLRKQRDSNEIDRVDNSGRKRRFEYEVFVTANPPDTHFATTRIPFLSSVQHQSYIFLTKAFPPNMEPVRSYAQELTKGQSSPLDAARAIERHFTDSGEYNYSLELSIEDASIDPIEDFLFNRKIGHCEYFASSMAIMLRGIGIPTRLVSGFKGGDVAEDADYYQVKQLHAHSWVEAYINDRWLTFDPTPPDRQLAVENAELKKFSFSKYWADLQVLWGAGARMSLQQQRELVYQPIQSAAIDSWNGTKGLLSGRSSSLKNLWNFLKNPGNWLSIRGGVIAFFLMLLISGCVWTIRRLWRLMSRLLKKRHRLKHRQQQIEFFDHFLKLLKHHGYEQSPTQTAKEFVDATLPQLNDRLTAKGYESWPTYLVHRFYDVRFGMKTLPLDEAREIDKKIRELSECFQEKNKS